MNPIRNPVFEEEVNKVKSIEGDYSDDPKDSGKKTRFGITEQTARAHGYTGAMKDLPWEKAKEIYYVQWWCLLNLDAIAVVSRRVAAEVFDTAVNCGQGIASKFLQRSLNVLNREERDYPDIRVDGLVGPLTVHSLKLYMQRRGRDDGERVLLRALNALQGARYIEIAEARKKDEKYTFGWFAQRVVMED